MNYGMERLCAWSGVVGVTVFFTGLIIAQFFPPPSPSLGMEEVAALYSGNANGIRTGFLLIMISGMFIFPFVAVISIQLRRIEHGRAPVMAYTQLGAGAAGTMLFVIPALPFLIAAFRPDRSPEITYLLNDFAWIMLVLPFSPAFMQNVSIGLAILKDGSANPLFPRWLAYFNFWIAIGFVPACTLVFFKSGPFAWNGLFPFWIPATVFGAWFVVMMIMVLKAINRQEQGTPALAT